MLGDRPDDERLLDALGGSSDLAQALADAAARQAIVVIDDGQYFSRAVREQLLRDDLAISRVIASREPLFEVAPGATKRLAIDLPPLGFGDAERLLRDLLEPARLIPEVLLQRLAIRANGNPGLLVALARDMQRRLVRRCGRDRYAARRAERRVAGRARPRRLAGRAGADRADGRGARPEVQRAGARGRDRGRRRRGTARAARPRGVLTEPNSWYEFADASLQDAIYDHALDERSLVHARALRYWLANRSPNLVGWLARVAHHALGCDDRATAAACSTTLAREARRRGEEELAVELEQRVLTSLVTGVPAAVADAVRALDELDEP